MTRVAFVTKKGRCEHRDKRFCAFTRSHLPKKWACSGCDRSRKRKSQYRSCGMNVSLVRQVGGRRTRPSSQLGSSRTTFGV